MQQGGHAGDTSEGGSGATSNLTGSSTSFSSLPVDSTSSSQDLAATGTDLSQGTIETRLPSFSDDSTVPTSSGNSELGSGTSSIPSVDVTEDVSTQPAPGSVTSSEIGSETSASGLRRPSDPTSENLTSNPVSGTPSHTIPDVTTGSSSGCSPETQSRTLSASQASTSGSGSNSQSTTSQLPEQPESMSTERSGDTDNTRTTDTMYLSSEPLSTGTSTYQGSSMSESEAVSSRQ